MNNRLEFMKRLVKDGVNTPEEATSWLLKNEVLRPGERMTATGVISGSAAEPRIPRHGSEETGPF